MARPVGGPSLPTTPSMTRPFAIPSSTRQVSAKQHHWTPQPSSFSSNTTSFTSSTPLPSQDAQNDKIPSNTSTPLPSTTKSHPQNRSRLDIHQHTTDLLRDLVIPYTNVSNASKSPSHEPWNLLDVVTPSMTSRSDITFAELQQTRLKPQTDSGYGSEKSRQRVSGNTSLGATYEGDKEYPYDEPIGSVAQQDHFLVDQQRIRPAASVISVSSASPSVLRRPSNNLLVHCPECGEGFNTKSEMSKHMARHDKKYVCDRPTCPRSTDGFATKNDLDRHKGSVHRDSTVTRKEFRCCVPGCKDPNKTWDRKDNFKAHVRRMHPGEDADDVVERSMVPDQSLSIDRPSSHSEIYGQEFPSPGLIPQSSNVIYPGPSMIENYPGQYSYNGLQDSAWPGEGDLYDASLPLSSRPQHYLQQLGTGPYQNPNSVPSATMGATTYPSSNTMPATNHATQDLLGPSILSHKEYLTPFEFGNSTSMNRMRPFDAHSAPVGPNNEELSSQVLGWTQSFEPQSSTTDASMALDPNLQSGAWQHSSPSGSYPQHIPEQQAQSNLILSTDEQQTVGQGINQRRDAMMQKITPILRSLSEGEMRLMMEAFHRHPAMSDKGSCTINTVIEAAKAHQNENAKAKPYVCTRHGCGKRFSAKNIRTKHEKRHDRLFFCTFDGCYSEFGSKDDLKRHEKGRHAPQAFDGYRCFPDDVPTSQHKLICPRFFDSKESFEQHRRDDHKERSVVNGGGLRAVKNCYLQQGKAGPFWCGFCNAIIQNEPSGTDSTIPNKLHYDHIDQHITKEGKTMNDWIDLKSGGFTKTQVRSNEALTEGDQVIEDEEMAEQPSRITPSVDESVSQTLSRRNHQPDLLFVKDRPRKRAYSDVDASAASTAAKQPRIGKYQTSRQVPSMFRGVSDMVRSPLPQTSVDTTRQLPASTNWVRCCQCNTFRPMSAMKCACNHEPCPACAYLNYAPARRY